MLNEKEYSKEYVDPQYKFIWLITFGVALLFGTVGYYLWSVGQ